MADYENIKEEFDQLSLVKPNRWDHNSFYFNNIVSSAKCISAPSIAIDIGCGTGKLASLISERFSKVIAMDLSPGMINKARENYGHNENINFIVSNALDYAYEENKYDFIVSSSAAHHLPYDWFLSTMKRTLKPGGTLYILDLYKSHSVTDYLAKAFAYICNAVLNIAINRRVREYDESTRRIWQAHESHDSFLSLNEIREIAKLYLPNVVIKRKLFWRYTLIWEKK